MTVYVFLTLIRGIWDGCFKNTTNLF